MYYPFTFPHIHSWGYKLEYYNSYCSYSSYSSAIVVVAVAVVATVVDSRIFPRDNMVNDNNSL